VPAALKKGARRPPDEARSQVRALHAAGVDAIKAVFDSGRTGMLFARTDLANFRAVVDAAAKMTLPASVRTGSDRPGSSTRSKRERAASSTARSSMRFPTRRSRGSRKRASATI